jgi:hypothetical protein
LADFYIALLYSSYNFTSLYLDKERGQQIVRDWYPITVSSVWMPSTMDAVTFALEKKQVICHIIILQKARTFALNGSYTLQHYFTSESNANDYTLLKKFWIVR